MVELVATAITVGAILFHNFHSNLGTVAVFSFFVALLGTFFLRSLKGMLFSILIGMSIFLGTIALSHVDVGEQSISFGEQIFDAKVVSVNRRLTRADLIVKEKQSNKKIQLFFYENVNLLPGDIVRFDGLVEAPESFLTDNGRLFDYPNYLKGKGVVAVVHNPEVVLKERGTVSLSRVATIIRFRIAEVFARHVSFPIDGIVAGMTVGYQGAIPERVQELFRDTGVLHVLVLSGYNITLLAGFLALLLRALPFRIRTILTIIAIVFLVVVSGSGVASVRAGIMGGIALLAGLAIRTYQPLRALTLSYLLFFFLSSEMIFSDPGFHLSFLATGFMILVFPRIARTSSSGQKQRGAHIREILLLSCTIPLFMLPYTMYFSGVFPLVSPVANILLSLLAPILMVLGIVLLTLSWIPSIADAVGFLISIIGSFMIKALEMLERFPLWRTPQMPWWSVLVFYTLFLGVLFRKDLMLYARQLRSSLVPGSNSSD